jgi:glycosyltransferase 2 family protein
VSKVKKFARSPYVRVGASLAILALLLFFVPLGKLTHAMASIPLTLWLKVLLGFLAVHLVGTIKWRLTLHLGNAKLSAAQAIHCYFAGLFGTVFLPSVVGGDVVRMGAALGIERNKAGVVLGSFVDRLLDIVALAVNAAIGLALLHGVLDNRSHKAFVVTMLLIASGIAAIVAAAALMPYRYVPFKFRRMMVNLRRAARSMASQPYYVLVSLLLGIVVQFGLIGLSDAIAGGCGLHLSLRTWLLVWPMAKLLALVPVTLGGLGIREAGLSALLAPFGVPMALAVAAGLAWESIMIAGGLAAGLVSVAIRLATRKTSPQAFELPLSPMSEKSTISAE